MKKLLNTGRKALSVFMAVIMLMTAWVWVAPDRASAVNSSGSYTWRLYINVTNDYTGDSSGYYTVTGKTNNGQGSDTTISNQVALATGGDTIFDNKSSAYFPSESGSTSTSFPYKVKIHTHKTSGIIFSTAGGYEAALQVKNSSGTWVNIASGSTGKVSGNDTDIDLTITGSSNFPTPTTIKWETESTADTADLTIGKTANVTRTMKFNLYDQYGVRMSSTALTKLSKTPTATVTASQSGTIGTSTSSNIYYTLSSSNTDAYYITVTAQSGAKSTTYDSQTITVGASCNSKSLTSRSFTLYDPQYTFTMEPNGGAMIAPLNAVTKRYYNTFGYTPNASREGFELIGFYATDYDDSYETVNVAGSDSKLTSSTYITDDITWYAAWQANKYKITFKYHNADNEEVTETLDLYYGTTLTPPEIPVEVIVENNGVVDQRSIFLKWNTGIEGENIPTTVPSNNATYTADYQITNYTASKVALKEAIKLAEEKLDEQKYIDGGYTTETVNTFETALDLASEALGTEYPLSQQSVVDKLTENLNSARVNLVSKKFIVMFVDEDGTILKDGYNFVEYGESVAVPANPTQEPDANNHYEFVEWNSTLSDGLDACDYVTDDLRFIATFNAIPHEYATTTTDSTCTEDGVITYTCDCGYTYTAANPDDLAHHTWSTDYKELIPATCATAGSEAKYCTVCGAIDESSKRDIAALGHNFGAYTEKTPATCFGQGSKVASCSRCQAMDVVVTDKLTHSYGEATTVAKTCTTDGYTKEVCELCGFTNIRDIQTATGHSLSTETKAATCVSSGYEMTSCENCDYEKTTIIPATGTHSFGAWTETVKATCISKGVEERVCSTCGYSETNINDEVAEHAYPTDWFIEVDPTCKGEGYKTKTCSICGDVQSETIAPLDHDYEETSSSTATCTTAGIVTKLCANCGDVNTTVTQATGHAWGTPVESDADCTHGGFTTTTCVTCGEVKLELKDGALATGHNFTNGTETITKPATCIEDGQKTIQCVNDGCSVVQTMVIPKTGHNHTSIEEKPATCTTSGYTVYKCACGDTYNVYDATKPATGHTYTEAITTPATCTAPGQKTLTCACGDVKTEVIPATGHTYTPDVTATDPTCTTSGYVTYRCSCGDSYKVYDENANALAHNYVEVENSSTATCTSSGTKTLKCSICGNEITVNVPKLGHDYQLDETLSQSATCATPATKTYKCQHADCDASYTISDGEKTENHTWGNWIVQKAATNTSIGYETRECSVCGKLEVQEIPATGDHKFDVVKETVNATCTADGYTEYDCSVHTGADDCGLTSRVVLPKLGHSEKLVYTAATCTVTGKVDMVCDTCNAVLDTQTIPTIAHTYDNGVIKAGDEPTCTTAGVKTFTCSCGATRTEPVSMTGHNLSTVVTDATCTEKGKVVTSCSNTGCTYKIETEIPVVAHVYGAGSVKTEPTCTTDGVMVYTCSCGATRTEPVSMIAHTYNTVVTDATCTADGSVVTSCTVCGNTFATTTLTALGHDLDVTVTNATCTTKGSVYEKCSRCDYEKTTEIELLAHNYSGDEEIINEATCTADGLKKVKCLNCADTVEVTIPKKGHNYGDWAITKPATCEADGEKTKTCANCGDVITAAIPRLGHSWSVWVKVDATNDTDGSWTRTCATCSKEEKLTIPAGGHNLVEDVDAYEAPTCTTTGKRVYKCNAHTDCSVTVTVTLDVKQHTIATRETPATCEVAGSVEAYCSACNTVLSTEEIAVIPHNYTAGTAVPATCTAGGYTPYTCTVCQATYNKYDSDPTRHSLIEGASTATCTTAGEMTLECENCNYSETVNVPALGHDYRLSGTTEATCAAPATKTYKCSHDGCDASYTIFDGDKTTTHTFGSWTVVKAATNTSIGYQTRECSVCGKLEVQEIAATGDHVYDNLIDSKAATCTDDGYKTYRCSATHDGVACTLESTVTVPATGHTEELVYAPATCTAAGSTKIVCSVEGCGEELASKTIPALGHSYTATDYTPATCNAKGSITYTCSECNDINTSELDLNPNAHQYTTTVTDATCTSAGSVITKCVVCGDTETEVLAVKGHIWKDAPESTTAATCTADGEEIYKCTNCNATNEVVLPKLGHAWGDWEVTTPSTNTQPGVMTRTCSSGCTETVEIPAGGHNLVETARTNASCTEEGSVTYGCNAHTDCGLTIEVTLAKTQHELETTDKPATCTTPGSVVTKCKNCDKATHTTIIPVIGHRWNDGVVTTPATCTTEGVRTFTCTAADCGETRTENIAKIQHVFAVVETVDPTCTSSGYTVYKCNTCNEGYSEIGAAPVGHDIVKSESKATCDTGDTITITCKNCTFSQTVDVPTLGHDYKKNDNRSTTANCAAAATETYECSRCDAEYTISVGEKATTHDFNEWVTVAAPTDSSLGYKTRTCKVCGKLEVETIAATGEHAFTVEVESSREEPTCTENGKVIYSCSTHNDCGETSEITLPATGHTEVHDYKAATCTEAGYSRVYCDVCKSDISKEEIPALEHVWGDEVVTPATCVAAGEIAYNCTRDNCTETHTVVIEIDADAHKYETSIEQAKCEEAGKVVTECTLCHVKTETAIPATGHKWNGGEEVTKATCEAEGLMKYTCTSCGGKSEATIPALGHVYQAGKTVDPTCTTSGYTVYTCKNDVTHTYNVYDGTEAKGHNWSEWTVETEATEITDGLKKRTCACGAKDEQVIPAMMHDMKEIENVPSTCSAAGHITYKCNIAHEGVTCDYTLTVTLPIAAHTLKTTVKEASCKEAGSVVTECTNGCGYKITEELATTPHKITASYAYPNCTTEGYVRENCEICGLKISEDITPAIGHNYSGGDETIILAATCRADGEKTVKCTRCSEVITVTIPKLDHNFEAGEPVAATCTTSGYTPYVCETCDASYNKLDSDPTGHTWNEAPASTVPATCETDGEKVYECKNCDETKTEIIRAFGHSWSAWTVVIKPTATTDGTQQRTCLRGCGEKERGTIPALGGTTTYTVSFVVDGNVVATQTVIHGKSATAPVISNKAPDAEYHYSYIWDVDFSRVTADLTVTAVFTGAGHNFGEWIVDTEATCKNQGTKHRVCPDCSYVENESIEKTAHSFNVINEKAPTCIDNGYVTKSCSACGATETETLVRLGHAMTYHQNVPETCTTDGMMAHYACSRCGKNFADRLGKTELHNVVIGMRYHTYIVIEGSDPTCTTDGVTDYRYCTYCGYTQNPTTIPALGHVDKNNDHYCDRCSGSYMEGGEIVCTCNCHKTGIFNELIYKILRFFWKLFGMNKSCECGAVHY